MMEESASAAENAWRGFVDLVACWGSGEDEHTMVGLLVGFREEGEQSLGLRGLERLVGMVRDMMAGEERERQEWRWGRSKSLKVED